MKSLLVASLLLSSASFAQSIDVATLKSLMTQRQAALESVNVGMSKQTSISGKVVMDNGECLYTQVTTQSILKIEGEKMIVLSKEKLTPTSPTCEAGGMKPYEESILFYELKPTLKEELVDLDVSAPTIQSISKTGEIITMNLNITETDDQGQSSTEAMIVKYDLTKSAFRNMISQQEQLTMSVISDVTDIDLKKVDLRNVLFCENNDGDNSDCVRGDYSDILF